MGLKSILTLFLLASPALSIPAPSNDKRQASTSGYWLENIKRQGQAAFNPDPAGYKVFRNVKDYGAVGDGAADDTDAINKAIADQERCAQGCESTTISPAIIYFPAGTYSVSKPIVQLYYTQFVGDATDLPTIKASASFQGMAVIDTDPYDNEGNNWWINQNNFFRQIRNFKIDLTAMPFSAGAGIHWQVAQATSLQNIEFNMRTDGGEENAQQGIFMDNGSGGFMSDLTFNGGKYGAFLGSQQFTTRGLTFNNCQTAIFMNWNWLWSFQDLTINNCKVGIDMSNGGPTGQTVGSVIVLDSVFKGTPTGVLTAYDSGSQVTNGSLVLDNVDMSGCTNAVENSESNAQVLAGGKIASYVQGKSYTGTDGKAVAAAADAVDKPAALLGDNGYIFTRSKPQYEKVSADKFISVKSEGAKGDGSTDDTAAIQAAMTKASQAEGSVLYFDHGSYIVTDTVKVPKNIKITGEIWPVIMAGGDSSFQDETNPKPVFQVGEAGDVGNVEISDLIFATQGPQPGAILMQWNLAGTNNGDSGMWDTHFRVGGAAGTKQELDNCAKSPTNIAKADPQCVGAFMLLHITESASVYLENTWYWVADHYLENSAEQINVYNGRGVLIESSKPVWMFGTASEHNQMYNYQLNNASNVYMTAIQTETAYMQGNPDATTPFKVQAPLTDPDFGTSCNDGSGAACARTWGFRAINSEALVYGAGLYSFFDNYAQDCLETQSCQENMVSLENSPKVQFYGLSTKAAVNMVTVDGKSQMLDKDNRNNFCAMVASFKAASY